ncbi:MAG: hypothetical protein UV00_C0018G0017 [candidate division WWE3 bacterium GW2011_GWF1_42_14]|uniref:M23ase beta-sheet core domain-containing protein n=2 Tax=Katanobacteria TaxID=422282 RepID=A0A0G1BHX1_UNCKA|nr:MAG: hypothetical protein UU92_C0014G0003 [candidate division WWE3 bacterium GW2011_GWA1_42_12]KKS37053.1 MAG: hypothetical protein UV00_C0018G0017 [candidate division WWE3 bacterium GW2011_GWF1_42_14]KKS40021.1 MAG: hypothetical protein UV03_C0014G0003 [candidate division WWE3 bacterium GW2011_GWE1_42_16]KKS66691.1 MAG: hypothetical protein UV35_C0009G0003 [candidate division WWE3 bacterium GW2011_GWB1_42_6]
MLLAICKTTASDWTSVSTPTNKLTTIEVTPEGIAAAEFDDRLWLNPYNGVYLSEDTGVTWAKVGLQGKGVKILKYKNGQLYAGTFYTTSTSRGLFVSRYPYSDWEHLGPAYNVTSIDNCGDYIYMGTTHNGLQVSPDKGNSWSQKIGAGVEGPEIVTVYCWDESVLASTRTIVYKSKDCGETWEALSEFNGISIYSFTRTGNYIAASGTGYEGIYISEDGGENWEKMPLPGLDISRKVTSQGQYLYTANGREVLSTLNRYKSTEDTFLDLINTTDVIDLEAYEPSEYTLLALNSSGKIFKKAIDDYLYSPVLDPPLNLQNDWELVEQINSYFDHEYPFLGYQHRPEPSETGSTTLKYNGEKAPIPAIYYSSHNGVDFDAEYGDPVLASAGGNASYYYCGDCGNTIKIDHGNGLQTVYMHLQNNPVVQGNSVIRVNNGDEIGKVGLTGRTTGPHIHFGVVSDVDGDGLFSDEYPHGVTDPFGWNYSKLTDPWSELSWNDSLGTHTGTLSRNLWKILAPAKQSTPLLNSARVTLGNKVVEIINDAGKSFLRLTLEHNSKPLIEPPSPGMDYVKGTAFVINVVDQLGNLSSAAAEVRIKLSISPEELVRFIPATIKIFRWDNLVASWVETASSYDSSTGVVEGILGHFSYFAAFGESSSSQPVYTQINISPEPIDGVVDTFPEVSFSGNGTFTVYSLDGGLTWRDYSQVINLDKPGLFDILYKSVGGEGKWEETKSFVLKVGTDLATKRIRIVGASFAVSEDDTSP